MTNAASGVWFQIRTQAGNPHGRQFATILLHRSLQAIRALGNASVGGPGRLDHGNEGPGGATARGMIEK
jgi:hypothetical protein